MLRRAAAAAAAASGRAGGLALVGQPALERVLADWLPLWSDPSRGGQEHPGLWSVGEWTLPPITVDDIKLAARK